MNDATVFMRLGDEDILAEVQIVPVIPTEPSPIDYREIRDELLTRASMKELVLSMWQDRAPAETIMRLMCLSETELGEILPKNLWLGMLLVVGSIAIALFIIGGRKAERLWDITP